MSAEGWKKKQTNKQTNNNKINKQNQTKPN